MYGARGSSLYLMTGMCDVTACADIVYGKHFRLTFHRLALFLLKMISRVPVPGRALEQYTLL